MQWRGQLLATQQLNVVGITNIAQSARDMLAQHETDALVCDLRLIDGPTSGAIARFRGNPNAERPHIVMVVHDDDEPELLEALRSGADSFYVFGRGSDSLADCVRKALTGESHITPTVAAKVLRVFELNPSAPGPSAIDDMLDPLLLTPPEHKLLSRVAAGADLEQIADKDSVSLHSLAASVRGIYRKLRWTLRAGALSLQDGGAPDSAWMLKPAVGRNR